MGSAQARHYALISPGFAEEWELLTAASNHDYSRGHNEGQVSEDVRSKADYMFEKGEQMLWRKEAYEISLWRCLWSGPVVAANGSRGPAILRILV